MSGLLPGRFVTSLLEEPEVEVTGAGQGPVGSIIHRLFVDAQRVGVSLWGHWGSTGLQFFISSSSVLLFLSLLPAAAQVG